MVSLEGLGGLEVDDERELRRLLDRKIARLVPLRILSTKLPTAVEVGEVRAINRGRLRA
jgi:hypothetical protein